MFIISILQLTEPAKQHNLRQMKEITHVQLQALTGASARNIDNWMARLKLATKYHKTVRGKPRVFTMDNAIEMTLLSRLTKCGFTASAASERVSHLFREWELAGKRAKWALLLWDDDTQVSPAFAMDEPPTGDTMAELVKIGVIYTVINVGDVLDHIETQFAKFD